MKVNSSLRSFSQILKDVIAIERRRETNDYAKKAKSEGISEGAIFGLELIEDESLTKEKIMNKLTFKINQSIYNIFVSEVELERKESTYAKSIIIYNDHLIETLQVIKEKLSKF